MVYYGNQKVAEALVLLGMLLLLKSGGKGCQCSVDKEKSFQSIM